MLALYHVLTSNRSIISTQPKCILHFSLLTRTFRHLSTFFHPSPVCALIFRRVVSPSHYSSHTFLQCRIRPSFPSRFSFLNMHSSSITLLPCICHASFNDIISSRFRDGSHFPTRTPVPANPRSGIPPPSAAEKLTFATSPIHKADLYKNVQSLIPRDRSDSLTFPTRFSTAELFLSTGFDYRGRILRSEIFNKHREHFALICMIRGGFNRPEGLFFTIRFFGLVS